MESPETKSLVEKWAPVLDFEDFAPIKNKYTRASTAVLLENQLKINKEVYRKDPGLTLSHLMEAVPANAMGASSSNPSDGAIDIYDPVLISLARRSMPNLMAYNILGVQPMALPTGTIFAMRSRYSTQGGIEALFNEADSTFTAKASGNSAAQSAVGNQTGTDPTASSPAYTVGHGMSTALGEALGPSGNAIPEMAMSIEKITVTALERKIRANYTNELAQDLKTVHGLEAETELANILSQELMAEINREVIRSIYSTATIGAQTGTTTAGIFDLDTDSNGRWMEEKFKGLMFRIGLECNQISKATRAGRGNFIVTSSDVATALNMIGVLKATDVGPLDVDDTGNTFVGTINGNLRVYIDPYFDSALGNNFVTVGYKGVSPFDAGMFFCPYVPLQLYRTMDPTTFNPTIGYMTRYGLVAHPFATSSADGAIASNKKNKYYRIFAAANLL